MRLFPEAAVLANADLSAVRTTIARREAIRDFSRRVLSGAISLPKLKIAQLPQGATRHQRSRPLVG